MARDSRGKPLSGQSLRVNINADSTIAGYTGLLYAQHARIVKSDSTGLGIGYLIPTSLLQAHRWYEVRTGTSGEPRLRIAPDTTPSDIGFDILDMQFVSPGV